MERIELLNGNYLCYERGRIDKWCVYEKNKFGFRKAPKDIEYFTELYQLMEVFDSHKLYNDFVEIYDMTTDKLDSQIVELIRKISDTYDVYAEQLFRIFAILYMGMIAEEQKENTKLGKRIKRLGMHVLLIEGEEPKYSAHFMRGKGWLEIDKLCLERGF